MLSAYGLSRKDLEDQVSVTNSIFGTDLSVNTDEEYIIHCDDLSKIIDPDNKYSWFGSLRNITTLSTNMSNSEILKKIGYIPCSNLAYISSICVPSGTIPYMVLNYNDGNFWKTRYYMRYPGTGCINNIVLTAKNNGILYMYDTDVNGLKRDCFALNKSQIEKMQNITSFNVCGSSGFSIQEPALLS
jgi:hypothetical protein